MITIAEYVEQHQLGVDPKHTGVAKMVAQHLTEMGYRRVRAVRDGVRGHYWTRDSRAVDLVGLAEKLKRLAVEGK